ncbi:MAG: GTP-binding protein [Rhodospirillales bacterium]|nr:GTP-binding protein [Rhodospirillales bacterium]
MRLKLYRATCMAEAMAAIRAELGVDALILASRRIGGEVEVTAALEPAEERPAPVTADPWPEAAEAMASAGAPPAMAPPPSIPPWIRPLGSQPATPRAAEGARQQALAFHAIPPRLAARLGHGPLADALGRALRFAPLPLDGAAAPLLFAGPPGAGKTLTVARLATRLVLGGISPMVITADAQRAGATEQLAAFTRLLQINLIVASHPVTLGRALLRRPPGVPVLIDAPGCDPFDPVQQAELAGLAASARAGMALVLPAGLDAAESADLATAFARLGARLLVATRLDLSRRLGGVLSAAAAGPLALAEAGIGPGAADGLIPFTPDDLAARLLAVPPAKLEPRA